MKVCFQNPNEIKIMCELQKKNETQEMNESQKKLHHENQNAQEFVV